LKCSICENDEVLPFKCSYCGEIFCGAHRLPENHKCHNLWLANPPQLKPRFNPSSSQKKFKDFSVKSEWKTYILFQPEILHLFIGSILVMLVGLSLTNWSGSIWFMGGTGLIFFFSFIMHELAHKYAAQKYGLLAKFQISPFGALITLISIISPFKIIAPGAVMISGYGDKNVIGKIAFVGPTTNFMIIGILYIISLFIIPNQYSLYTIIQFGIYVNSIIAFFNLIPFGIFDGQKIFAWNKAVWGLLFFASILFIVLSI